MVTSHTMAKLEPNTSYERNMYLELSDRHRALTITVLVPLSVNLYYLFHQTVLKDPIK